MKRMFIIMALFCSAAIFAVHGMTLSEIVSYMATNDYRRSFALTNELNFLIASTTGVVERSTCKLLKASILIDHSENMADTASFDVATNLCCEIETELADRIAWQRIGALNKFTNAMIEDGHPEVSFVASTNILAIFQSNQYVDVDTNVWNVLFKAGGLDLMTPLGFVNADVAASLSRMNPNAELAPYTNGIPSEVLYEIIRR